MKRCTLTLHVKGARRGRPWGAGSGVGPNLPCAFAMVYDEIGRLQRPMVTREA
ncbi:MAG: hypothetical protein Q8L55_15430 [Phycisphaerales bacterium]|nr:hypothetical protein [Phycisphaerales bacterium]